MITLISLLTIVLQIPYEKIITVSSDWSFPNDEFIVLPTDALFWKGTLFIADGKQHKIFMVSKNKSLHSFGKEGNGPGEFKNFPQSMAVEDGVLKIFEWNAFRVSLFDEEGVYIDRMSNDRNRLKLGSHFVTLLTPEAALKEKHLFKFSDTDVHFGELEDDTDEGFHNSRGFLLLKDDKHLLLVKRPGSIEEYSLTGQRTTRMLVPIELLKREPKENKQNTEIYRAMGGKVKAFDFGIPILAAVNHENLVWLLVINEHDEHRFLYEFDTDSKSINWKQSLDTEVHRINFNDGVLILIAGNAGKVIAYNVNSPNNFTRLD